MSVYRLILGIWFLAIAVFWFVMRDRVRASPDRPNGMHPTLFAIFGPAWLVMGIAWLVTAFV